MATIEIKDVKGAAAGTVELSDAVFAIEPNVPVMHRTVKAQQASWRQGTANTRTRGMVRGGGKKPWRQKGTGRARQGTIRAPQWVGGGTVFGPHTRSYDQKVNKKEIKLAMRSALSAKLADGELFIVKDMDFEKPCTKDANKVEIRQAIEAIFNVKVVKVNTLNVKSKPKRVRYQEGRTRTWKKAMVTLAEGETIEIFAS